MTPRPEYDAVIAGAGPAGAATALSLARAGRRVLVLERRAKPRARSAETIAPAAKVAVEAGLGPMQDRALPDWAAPSRGNISIWGGDAPATQDFFFNAYGPGLCVDRAGFDAALLEAARAQGVEVQTGTVLTAARYQDERWAVTLEGPSGALEIHAAYLVDATGRTAALGRLFALPHDRGDPLFSYALAFEADGPATGDMDGYTRIEAAPNGWWYSNRLPGTHGGPARRLVVFHTDRDTPNARQAATADGLLRLLATTTLMRPVLAEHGYRPQGRVQGAPAGNAVAANAVAKGFVAVGDAAQAHDPLSSQGVERALTSGALAGLALHYALSNPDAPQPFLARYQQQMRAHWQTYLAQHAYYYAMEPRWAERPFWARRATQAQLPRPEFAGNTQ